MMSSPTLDPSRDEPEPKDVDPEGNPTGGLHVEVPGPDEELAPETDMIVIDEGSGMDELPEPSPSTPLPSEDMLPAGEAWNQPQLNEEVAARNALRKETEERLTAIYRSANQQGDFVTALNAATAIARLNGLAI